MQDQYAIVLFNLIQQVAGNAIRSAQARQYQTANNLLRANFGPKPNAPMVPQNFIPPQVQQLKPATSMTALPKPTAPVNQQRNVNTFTNRQPQPVPEPKTQSTVETTMRKTNFLQNSRIVMGERNTNVGTHANIDPHANVGAPPNTLYSDGLPKPTKMNNVIDLTREVARMKVDAGRVSVFDRLGPKAGETERPKPNIHARLQVSQQPLPQATEVKEEKTTNDAVDFVSERPPLIRPPLIRPIKPVTQKVALFVYFLSLT